MESTDNVLENIRLNINDILNHNPELSEFISVNNNSFTRKLVNEKGLTVDDAYSYMLWSALILLYGI